MSYVAVKQEELADRSIDQSLTLVDGNLSIEDAYESVRKLIYSAKSYFELRNFSHEERFGQSDTWSEEMLFNIESRSKDVISLIDEARDNGKKVRVTATIAVEVDEN